MFRRLVCLLKGHDKNVTVTKVQSDLTNRELLEYGKLVGSNPTPEFIKEAQENPDGKREMTQVSVKCKRCHKILPNFNETREQMQKDREN